ncbi:uncharacterized protein [Montipora capricornis]|uniref:uncharacterized protein n=1 Tax=Montipora capricornis TaxID=246305 RepID=UPI0035F1EC05
MVGFKRNSSSLDKGSGTSYELRKKAKVSFQVTHPHDSTPEAHEVSPSKEMIIKDFEVSASGSQSTFSTSSSLEFARKSQEELKKIYGERPLRCGKTCESRDSEESDEEEFTEEQWKQTGAYKLLHSYFAAIAKQPSTS